MSRMKGEELAEAKCYEEEAWREGASQEAANEEGLCICFPPHLDGACLKHRASSQAEEALGRGAADGEACDSFRTE